ncbi:divalent-cation tolerance protein CutA [Actinoplanes xinjiangensis]|uniref:Divalent cation tolerance protein n=1 Tax=Actinoplanes xinjiangensis TaxID=512350 RepID=A0A316FF08_9ACTN|nr:divalent-cation tolerance protein CutA [Actinoplanes xinjiangensis]PWK46923.1 divalent cation tolerance protein [Actinoplanes xinjiangensis]GIF40081.1 divalent cation tolerance protein [Actinoplanes xinjiangensis]
MATDHVLVLTTAPSEEEGRRLARELVDARLAACVQMSSQIRSVYRWKGEVYDEPEWQLWIKTASDKVEDLMAWLPEHHSYEVPELIVLPITGGWSPYLDWITAETRA